MRYELLQLWMSMPMRREDVSCELRDLAFEFFFRFTRFEFALKENDYLKDPNPGARAAPGWDRFVADWHRGYRASNDARRLIDAAPKRQVVGPTGSPEWEKVGLDGCQGELGRVIRLLQTVRNNLFHGGKHGDAGWDDPKRTAELLTLGIAILGKRQVVPPLQAQAASDRTVSGLVFQGSNSSMRLLWCSAMRSNTSASHA